MTTKTETQTIDKQAVNPVILEEVKGVMTVIAQSDGGPSVERELNAVGADAIGRMNSARELMKTSVERALPSMSKDSPLAKTVNDAVIATTELNPNTVTSSFLFKYVPIPFVRKMLLKGYVENFQSSEDKVQLIFDNLQGGKEALLEDALDLESQYKTLREASAALDRGIEVTELAQLELDKLDVSTMDEFDQNKYKAAASKLARRNRELHTAKSAIGQFFISINQTFETNILLNESIDSICSIGPMVLQNAIMLHAAINRQKQVIAATQNAKNAINEAMLQNARTVNQNAKDVAELYNDPVIAIETFKESFNELQEAIRTTATARDKSTDVAKQMVLELKAMDESMAPVNAQLEDNVAEYRSAALRVGG
jgi:uncharacterized protein YaaN involved in tellurite resistance